MSEPSDPRIGTSVEGRYKLEERLAAGGMGVVYRAEQVDEAKPVAVKFLHEAFAGLPDLVKRFQREVSAMSRVAHPNLVAVIDSGMSAGVPYLVMDFHAGRPLSELLEKGALEPARAVSIARQVLAGVEHAHASGVVHRDLKPDNIMLLAGESGDDFVKILDFGLAKMVDVSGATQLTSTGFALGTPGYMSPEQARGTATDERTDFYAIGVIIYQMVVGRKPFIAETPMAVLRMHMEDPPVPPRRVGAKVSAALEGVILRALEKEPARRFASAAEFARALAATPEAGGREEDPKKTSVGRKKIVSSPSLAAAEAAKPARPRRPTNWPRIGKLLLAAAVIAGGIYGWNRLSHRSQQRIRDGLGHAVKATEGAWNKLVDDQDGVKGPESPNGPNKTGAPKFPSPLIGAKPPTPAEPAAAKSPTEPAAAKTPTEPTAAKSPTEAAEAKSPTEPPAAKTPTEPAAPSQNSPPETAPEEVDENEAVQEPAPPRDTPGARLEAESEPAAPSPAAAAAAKKIARLQDAARLLAAGHTDESIQTLYQVRRRDPRDADVALLLGHAYFRKLWRTDALREYNEAVKLRPALRHDRALVHNTVAALDDPTYRLARAIIKLRLGVAALAEVRLAARTSKNPKVHRRAAVLAEQLGHTGGKRRRR